jgi:hypothetical protein
MVSPRTVAAIGPLLVEEMIAEGLTLDDLGSGYWRSPDGVPYGYDIHPADFEIDQDELETVQRIAGAVMKCDVSVHIFVSSPAGRPALARIAHRLAGRTDGWVFVEFDLRPSKDLLDRLSRAGRTIAVDDALYLDADAMAAWIADSRFHVVK